MTPYIKKDSEKYCKKKQHFVAQVKGNQKELFKWVEFNSMVSEAIDTYISYDHNMHGRYEQHTVEVFDDLYQIEKEWTMI